MSDVVTGVRQVIQDLVAPDLKAVRARVDALDEKMTASTELLSRQMELQFRALITALDSFRAEMRAEVGGLRSASRAEVTEQLSPIIERVARLEALIETRQ
jgi:tetrahydromethanopterin S-methyltransferase subunit B